MQAGDRLGPYEVVSLLGAGGMGEVYKARDTRLGRTVALKVLLESAGADAERRRRFEQEARAVSALSHPHICVLHDIGSAPLANASQAAGESVDYLVMEFLEGQTLADRLARGPLPVDQALELGIQIADALAAAHRAGIVHRDLKPANVMLVKAAGAAPSVKLLDFGLARLAPPRDGTGSGETLSVSGMVSGTAPYMAPEQVEARSVDARTDLFAFGAVLYEMLTATRAFEGASPASVLAAILAQEPRAASSLQPSVSPGIDRVIRRCLAKDPDGRWQTASDLAAELRWLRETAGGGAGAPVAGGASRPRWQRVAVAVAAVAALVAVAVAVTWLVRPAAPSRLPAGMSLDLRPAEIVDPLGGTLTPGGAQTAFAWSVDGRRLVFSAYRGDVVQLWVRNLDEPIARPLEGTDGARAPAVSADGQWVAFWASRKIRKIGFDGGPIVDLASDIRIPPRGIAWDDAGRLYFGNNLDSCIWIIEEGKAPRKITKHDEGEGHALPSPLPGGKTLLYLAQKRMWWGDGDVVALTLADGKQKRLLANAADARYLPSGHLVFLRRGVLMAVAFDPVRLEVKSAPEIMLDSVAQALAGIGEYTITGAGQYAVATTGALAWISSPVIEYPNTGLVRVDRHGQITRLPAEPRPYLPVVRVSPDGRRLAVPIRTSTTGGLWEFDLERTMLMPVQEFGETSFPVWWSKDARRIVFLYNSDGRNTLAWATAGGSARPQVLLYGALFPSSSTDDGQLAVVRANGTAPDDVILVTEERGHVRQQVLIDRIDTPSDPQFSPDGRWLAYCSRVTGRREVYLRPFPGPGKPERITIDGGESPAWNPKGVELFFASLRKDKESRRFMMVVDVRSGKAQGASRQLFEYDRAKLAFGGCDPTRCYDVAPDGQSFYLAERPVPSAPVPVNHLNYVPNWVDELKKRVPVK